MSPCGCAYVHPWRTLCPAALAWEAKLRAALGAGDTLEARRIGCLLAAHFSGAPLPEETVLGEKVRVVGQSGGEDLCR